VALYKYSFLSFLTFNESDVDIWSAAVQMNHQAARQVKNQRRKMKTKTKMKMKPTVKQRQAPNQAAALVNTSRLNSRWQLSRRPQMTRTRLRMRFPKRVPAKRRR